MILYGFWRKKKHFFCWILPLGAVHKWRTSSPEGKDEEEDEENEDENDEEDEEHEEDK